MQTRPVGTSAFIVYRPSASCAAPVQGKAPPFGLGTAITWGHPTESQAIDHTHEWVESHWATNW